MASWLRSIGSAVTLLAFLATFSAHADVTGKARVIDGDTLAFRNQRVRLHGIDAPEAKQTCGSDGKPWNCGEEATFALANLVANHWIECKEKDKDRYGRIVAVCYAGNHDLNARMVSDGWALAYRRYSVDYVNEEARARASRAGIWRGNFTPPWKWRMWNSGASKRSNLKDQDCSDFKTWQDAQDFFKQAGPGDPHGLDRDKDGEACEGLWR